jgi:hypothetical protein
MGQELEFLKQDISELRSEIRGDLVRIYDKIDDLSQFKWKVLGGSMVWTGILSIAVSIAAAILSR